MLESNNRLGYGGERLNTRLPQAVAELQGLTVSGPLTGASANTPILVADGIDIQDTILKALLFSGGVPSDVTAATSVVDLRATGTLTLSGVVAGDTTVVNGKTYTAVTFSPNPSNGAVGSQKFAVGATDAITAANLAAAIIPADARVFATSAGAVVTVKARNEGQFGNAFGLVGGAHITASAATLTGGGSPVENGTITVASAVPGDTVNVGGIVYTAVAADSGAPVELNQFRVSPSAADLVDIGVTPNAAAALAATPNEATAFYLAHQINADEGAVAGALATGAVVAVFAKSDAQGPLVLSSSGSTLAVTGSGFMTPNARMIKISSDTSGGSIVLMWYRKPRQNGLA